MVIYRYGNRLKMAVEAAFKSYPQTDPQVLKKGTSILEKNLYDRVMLYFAKDDPLPPYVRVKKSTRARRLALRLDTRERVFHLVVPRGVSLKKAHEFAEGHEGWMQEKLDDLPKQVRFRHGAIIPILGRRRTLEIAYDRRLTDTTIVLKRNTICVMTNQKNPEAKIKRFLMKLAKQELSEMVHRKALRVGKKVRAIQIRDTKSRWGSCSEDRKISLSWRLILAPAMAMDYVVAHEVAHLVHLDHSTRFWNLCRQLSKDYVEGKYWMQNHGHELMRYGSPERKKAEI